MTRADELRAQARSLYDLAKATSQPDESLLHVLHAIELEADADLLDRGDIPQPHVIDIPRLGPATTTVSRPAPTA
jgi:hypothetical protein